MAVDFFLNGTGSGLLAVGSSMFLMTGRGAFLDRPVVLAGVLVLVAGLLALASELGKPSRVLYALSNLRSSWLSRGVLLNGLLLVASLVMLFETPSAYFALLILALAVSTASYPSFLLHAANDIELWRTWLVIGLFLSWAFAQGGAMAGMLVTGSATLLSVPMLALVAVTAAAEGLFFGRKGKAGGALDESRRARGSGGLGTVYRYSVVLGLVAPLVLFGASLFILTTPLFLAGGLLLLAGSFRFRYTVLKTAYHGPLSVLHGADVDKSVYRDRKTAAGEGRPWPGDPHR